MICKSVNIRSYSHTAVSAVRILIGSKHMMKVIVHNSHGFHREQWTDFFSTVTVLQPRGQLKITAPHHLRLKRALHCYGTIKYYIISLYETIHINTDDTITSCNSTDRNEKHVVMLFIRNVFSVQSVSIHSVLAQCSGVTRGFIPGRKILKGAIL